MSHAVFVLDVRLKEIEPPIWRAVEVPGAASLADVHYALQVAMGWTNSHLHQFVIGGRWYGMKGLDEDAPRELQDENRVRLEDVVRAGESFVYEYDFGDGWEHLVTVKAVNTVAKAPGFRCVAGARACPPEDSGGPHGYANLLGALADPTSEQHAELAAWAGDFDPEAFELPKGGLALRRDMEMLRELAESGHGDDVIDDDPAALDLPPRLVDAALALDPMKRASLCALIAASLAQDALAAEEYAAQLIAAAKSRTGHKASRATRKRGR